MRGNIECVQLLERHGQDLEQLTRSGRTPLEIAAAFGHYELVDYLLSKDCTMDTVPRPLKSVKVRATTCDYVHSQ
jgi:ankyrin repeat protein